MKITEKVIIIPPFISTTWNNVAAIHMKGNLLAVTLIDGDTINVPGLKQDVIETIFNFHALFLEKESSSESSDFLPSNRGKMMMDQTFDMPFRVGIASLDGLTNALQHNPSQSNSPEIPPEVLNKICAITKIMAPDESLLPRPEPLCNCPHCQIARALHPELQLVETFAEEEVSEAELQFQQWEIMQTGDNLFTVVNRLDHQERYNVFLGHPVGCTCGKQGCEHILAVLKS